MAEKTVVDKKCVWHGLDYEHDVLIEASAGTGKTYALENIVLTLICEKGYEAKSILLVTYTEKAAGELKNRVREALVKAGKLPVDFDEMTICTIHSFCQRILSEYAFENGVPMRCEIGGDSTALAHRAVLEALKSGTFNEEYKGCLYDVLSDIDIPSVAELVKIAQKIIEAADYANLCQRMEELIAARKTKKGNKKIRKNEFLLKLVKVAYPRFLKLKEEAALLTFDDIVAHAAEVVCKIPKTGEEKIAKANFFKSIRSRYRVALVDEFQDTDQKQWDIFRTLFSAKFNEVQGLMPGFLLVVGDPKQAIYSFRGADVGVYCAAREILTENDAKGENGEHKWRKTLDETYRSKRNLIDAFNVFFGNGWFENDSAGEGIEYTGVSYPRLGNKKFDDITKECEERPILLLESMPERVMPSSYQGGCFGNKSMCLSVFMENAANEMNRLKELDAAYMFKDVNGNELKRRFGYGDMCVLVESKADAAVVRSVLSRHGIPYGQYKQQGLYDSPEAEGVLALFDYISNPSARGNRTSLLISPIFNVHPSELVKRNQTDEGRFDKFIERLRVCAREKEWNKLFELVMSEDCTSLMHPKADLCAFNRIRAATRQIFDELLIKCGNLADTVDYFAATLREWRKNDKAAGEDGALYKKESNADKVQIMTMHASKGLQFPIVFLAYGFANQIKKETPDEEKPAARQERRRLLYVALTRAEHRLYLPWSKRAWSWEAKSQTKDGEKSITGSGLGSVGSVLLAGSENGFLGKAILAYFNDSEDRERDKAFAPEYNAIRLRESAKADGLTIGDYPEAFPVLSDVLLEIPELKSRRVQWDSFSLMQKHSLSGERGNSSVAEQKEITVESESSREAETDDYTLKVETLLARNNVSGNVFHEIMETLCNNDNKKGEVDFETACDDGMAEDDSALLALIRQAMRRNVLINREKEGDSTEKTLVRMVQNALNTEITIGGMTFRLKDIPRKNRMAEVEFVADENNLLNLPVKREGTLNGKIDLLVRVGDKVIILDWKTNSLSDYTDSAVIEAAMNEADYHLQYQLYSLAVDVWLKSWGVELAGAAYLFVRGGEVGSKSGLFVRAFDACGVEQFRNDISQKGFFAAGKEAE